MVHHVPIPDSADDDVSNKRNLELLKRELEKSKPSVEATKSVMECTFSLRWNCFVNCGQPPSLQEYHLQYPVLKKATYVSACIRACCMYNYVT